MSVPVIPAKTALGQEELRRRTGGLGQRHRTILFLIDGRRPLSEVLSLAQQAGAATNHFEDLVRLGYVELPPQEAATEPADLPATAEAGQLTHVELTVHGDETAPPVAAPVIETVVLAPDPVPPPAPIVAPAPPPAPIETAVPVAPVAPERLPADVPVAPVSAPRPSPEPMPPLTLRRPAAPLRSPVARFVSEEEQPLENVRQCLLETLRLDPTPFGHRAPARVLEARTAAALTELVWQIERDVSHSRRSRAGLQSLQRARELLGLGNTLVDEDSKPPPLDDDAW